MISLAVAVSALLVTSALLFWWWRMRSQRQSAQTDIKQDLSAAEYPVSCPSSITKNEGTTVPQKCAYNDEGLLPAGTAAERSSCCAEARSVGASIERAPSKKAKKAQKALPPFESRVEVSGHSAPAVVQDDDDSAPLSEQRAERALSMRTSTSPVASARKNGGVALSLGDGSGGVVRAKDLPNSEAPEAEDVAPRSHRLHRTAR